MTRNTALDKTSPFFLGWRRIRPLTGTKTVAVVFCAVSALFFAFASSRAKGRVPAQVLSSGETRLVFRVELDEYDLSPSMAVKGAVQLSVPGFLRRGEQGEPARPARKFLVGLPPAGNYSVSWRVLASVPLGRHLLEPTPYLEARHDGELGVVTSERYAVDGNVYRNRVLSAAVVADDVAYIRRQRVLPLWVEPLSFNPGTGEASLATQIEIQVDFSGDTKTSPEARGGESPAWERLFARLLVNAETAAKWRTLPRERAGAPPYLAPIRQAGALLKLKVRKTGVHRVSAATLIPAGLPANTPVTGLHLFYRDYDEDNLQENVRNIAYDVLEGGTGTPGIFDGDDVLVFYGRSLRDDASRGDFISQYSDYNVYWLGTTSGPQMADRGLTPGFLTADTLSASFPVSAHFETDNIFREGTPEGVKDFYLYNAGAYSGHTETRVDMPFELEAVKPGTTLQLRAQFWGQQYNQFSSIAIYLVNARGNTTLNPAYTIYNKDVANFLATVPEAVASAGANTFRFEAPQIRALLNWLEVSYQALYRARGNVLSFNTASLSGDTSLTVTGLSSNNVYLFDVTDPNLPVNCVVTPGLFTPVGGGYALTFRESISSRKNYVVVSRQRMIEIGAADVQADTPSDLIGGPAEAGVDVLVISHKDFLSGMADWVRYRRAQGYSVLMADVEDVYDEFNNGIPGVRGIDRFIRHFYELGNAGYVLLVGDANEDSKRKWGGTPPNYVPTHARAEYVGQPFYMDEVVTSDKLYVKLPGPTGSVDAYPDLAIARFPVGSANELRVVLTKIFAYEKPRASDFWRRRMILVADDAYSAGSNYGYTTYRPSEEYFRLGQEEAARIIERAYPSGGYDVVRFYLADYTWPLHPDTTDALLFRSQTYTRTYATPPYMDALKQGAMMVSIQAHMNRFQICSEKLMVTEGGTVSPPNRDHLRIDNRDKPFVVFGLGCHFSDYALFDEMTNQNTNLPNGDCFAEQLLLQPDDAVSTYGSTGFEYLSQTNLLMTLVTRVWFYDAPYQDLVQQTEGRWVFGELMFLCEAEAIGLSSGMVEPIERYHILGDPLLRMDAGPPRFDVTVNGEPVHTGDAVKGAASGDSILVEAVVRDENAIDAFELVIDGETRTQDLHIEALADESIPVPRGYRVSFRHQIKRSTEDYQIVLKAFQAPDTSAGVYHMAAEFVLGVETHLLLYADGRPVGNGDVVPTRANYRVELSLPVVVDPSDLGVKVDGDPVPDVVVSAPEPGDSTVWVLTFSKSLKPGPHTISVVIGDYELSIDVRVSVELGLKRVLNYPNPFTESTYFVYTNEVEITDGTIDVYTTSGKKVARLYIPPDARSPGENTVFWDGRDSAGDEIANGTYLYVVRVNQRGEHSLVRGKLARIR